MKAYTYISSGKFELIDKPKPELHDPRDTIVRITLGSVSRAVPNITIDHEIKRVSEQTFCQTLFFFL